MNVSKIKQLKERYDIILTEYKDKILPYQLAINNINHQEKCIKDMIGILIKQDNKKRINLKEVYKEIYGDSFTDRILFFKQKQHIRYNAGKRYFHLNCEKLKAEYTDILTYISLKKLLLNYQINCITINTVSELCYYADSLYGNFDIMQLQYKKYDFIYKLLKSRGLYIKSDVYSCYIYDCFYTNNDYRPFKNMFSIKIPKTMQVSNDTDNEKIPFNLEICETDKIYPLLDKFLQYIKLYTTKLSELKQVKSDATIEFKLFNNNTGLDGWIIEDICESYNYNARSILDLALSYNKE